MSSDSATVLKERPAQSRGRIDLLDVARAVALLAMLVYHFTWDLEFFGYLPAGTVFEGGWRIFARTIATSFLVLVGISLVLAHPGGVIRRRPYLIRLAQVVAGATAVSAATYAFTPQSFVFFGILHQIAFASVVGLVFLRAPAAVTALAGLAVIALPIIYQTDVTNTRWLAWIGLSTSEPLSNDLVPVFPWTGVVLFGMAAGRLATNLNLWARLRTYNSNAVPMRVMTKLGRHSLAFYLIHQPASLALVAAYAWAWPADRVAHFPADCQRSCVAEVADEAYCTNYCGCVQSELTERNLLSDLLEGRLDEAGQSTLRETILTCSANAAR
ncbi:heparan-alpha-glucosaminide N-acetyltransferase [Aureimonas mangrovi]|uniref:heparan-alpha-glucosaminide N-acetyltransferase n=1 Tax=Aureimonas mangrovi TaxID=2758041 RepID=UPI00163D65A6|nr:heparan-alpha-glucosaminide N-acetyltransferase [Aureimonas mangrovi]